MIIFLSPLVKHYCLLLSYVYKKLIFFLTRFLQTSGAQFRKDYDIEKKQLCTLNYVFVLSIGEVTPS